MAGDRDREPSMEEILASIKKVISEEGDLPAPRLRPQRRPDSRDRGADDVLELTSAEALEDSQPQMDDSFEDPAPESPLVDEGAARSVRSSLAALATLAEPGVPPQIVRQGETSLEGMVRDMLRPMLKEWLDANLPTIVEAAVAKEVARITRR